MQRKHHGFTLIELMIVIAIIGILASIAMPSYRDYVRKANAQEALTLINAVSKKAINFYSQQGFWPRSTSELAQFDSTVSATEADYATDVIHTLHVTSSHVPAGSGGVWTRINPGAFGNSGISYIRAVLTDTNGMISIDWCNFDGGYPTGVEAREYVC